MADAGLIALLAMLPANFDSARQAARRAACPTPKNSRAPRKTIEPAGPKACRRTCRGRPLPCGARGERKRAGIKFPRRAPRRDTTSSLPPDAPSVTVRQQTIEAALRAFAAAPACAGLSKESGTQQWPATAATEPPFLARSGRDEARMLTMCIPLGVRWPSFAGLRLAGPGCLL